METDEGRYQTGCERPIKPLQRKKWRFFSFFVFTFLILILIRYSFFFDFEIDTVLTMELIQTMLKKKMNYWLIIY